MKSIISLAVATAVLLQTCPKVAADDWGQWRGPNRDGVWNEEGIRSSLPDGQLPVDWTVTIGPGYSGPTVADGRVYVTDRIRSPQQERVLCFDSKSGDLIWEHKYASVYTIGYKAGPRASVTIDGGKAYAVGAMGHLHCLDALSGEIVWKRDLESEYNLNMPIWGIAASPLIYKDTVIQQVAGSEGACIVAFDKATGKERWRALDEKAGYAAPILIKQAGMDVAVCWTGESLTGLDAATGDVYWSHAMRSRNMPIGIATPVYDQGRVFVSSFYDGSLMVTAPENKTSSELIWRAIGRDEKNTGSKKITTLEGEKVTGKIHGVHAMIGTPIVRGENVFAVDSYGELRCLDAQDGSRIWEDATAVQRNRWATIHMVQHGSDVWMFNEQGELLLTQLSKTGLTVGSRAQLVPPTREQLNRRNGVCWSHPAFAEKSVFVRTDEQLVRASLSAAPGDSDKE